MSYRTTCPHCASVFHLNETQLDAAEAWVQCSVCGGAFDARPSLLMADGSPLPVVQPAQPEAADIPAPAQPSAASGADTSIAADLPHGITLRETALDLPSIILIDPDIPLPSDPEALPQFDLPPAYSPAPTAVAAAAVTRPGTPDARINYANPLPGTAPTPSRPRRSRAWIWVTASALLLLTLLAQTGYFLRDTLVSQLPQTRPAAEQICAQLGCTLSLPKNLALLQIVGSDLQTEAPARGTPAGAPLLRSDPAAAPARGTPAGAPLLRSDPAAASGRLKLSLTLGNRAGHAQAWPMLVLTLTDQHNRPLARRSFAPSEYLSDAKRIATGIPGRSEQDLNLPLSVRDLAPMGFELKLSY